MVRLFVLAVIGSFVALSTHAQTAIKRPIRSIVASPPGGPSDVQMRLFAPKMGEALGQTIVVDNRPSNNAIVGMEIGAKSLPDGHTFIKDWSENTGMLKALVDAKLVEDTGIRVPTGYVEAALVRVIDGV